MKNHYFTSEQRRVRSLGQHMLNSQRAAEDLVASAGIKRTDVVVEIGMGKGAITRELCLLSNKVIAYEIDERIAVEAKSLLADISNLEIKVEDAFTSEIDHFDVCATSLPYSQSLKFVKWLSLRSGLFRRCVAVIQEEFWEKLIASPGEKSYRAVSVLAQRSFRLEKLFDIEREKFEPHPQVSSVAIRITPRTDLSEPFFTQSRIVALNQLFSYRGRLLSSFAKKTGELRIETSVLNSRVENLEPLKISEIIEELEGTRKR